MTATLNAVLADLARAEAERHPPRTPERRAAAEVWVALSTTADLAAARRVLLHGGDPSVRATALALLGRLTGQDGTPPPTGDPS